MQTWHAFRNAQARRRAVEWLADNSLIDFDAATRHIAENSYPEIPWETQAWADPGSNGWHGLGEFGSEDADARAGGHHQQW